MLVLVRLILDDQPGALSRATAAIAEVGGNIIALDVVDGDGTKVVDDFVVELDCVEPRILEERLAAEPDIEVECVRPTPETELCLELEQISTLSANPQPSLDLLARLVPAIVRCDWAVVISSADSTVRITHTSGHGPRVRWESLPWLPLAWATALDPDENWVPSTWQSEHLALAAAPVNRLTSVLASRRAGPPFRPRSRPPGPARPASWAPAFGPTRRRGPAVEAQVDTSTKPSRASSKPSPDPFSSPWCRIRTILAWFRRASNA